MANPHRRRHHRRNPESLRRRRAAARAGWRHRHRNPRRHRRNPSYVRVHHRRHRNRRNPDINTILYVGAGAAVGAVATRGVTQILLGNSNSGYMGVGANIGIAIGLGWLAGKLKLPANFATGVMAGGVGQGFQRLYEQVVAPTMSSALSGLGDPWYSKNGLGEYQPYSTFSPNAFPPALPSTSALTSAPGVI